MHIDLSQTGLQDTIAKLLKLPGQYKAARNASMTYAGAGLLREFRSAAKGNTLGWAAISPLTQWIKKHKPQKGAKALRMTGNRLLTMWQSITKRVPWGRLLGALAFQLAGKETDALTMTEGIIPGAKRTSGVLSPVIEKYATAMTKGSTRAVDPAMRRYFAAIGIPLRKTTTALKAPERPLIIPVWERFRARFLEMFQAKFLQKVFTGWNSNIAGGTQ